MRKIEEVARAICRVDLINIAMEDNITLSPAIIYLTNPTEDAITNPRSYRYVHSVSPLLPRRSRRI